MGEVDSIEFKVIGKQILELGWWVVFVKDVKDLNEEKEGEDENVFFVFVKGESGLYILDLNEKWIQLFKFYMEVILFCVMEIVGKLVDNDEFWDVLKENGIGCFFICVVIIEIFFKCNYICKEKKNLIVIFIGVELIQLIYEELLKLVELMGIWEKKLCEIEKKIYDVC